MNARFLLCLAASLLLLFSRAVWAQGPPPAGAATHAAWFELRDNALQLHAGGPAQPLTKNVTLLNGTRLDYQARTAVLADGRTVTLREGDRISLSGTITAAGGPSPEAPRPTVAPVAAVAPAPAAAPIAISAPAKPTGPATFTFRPTPPIGGKLKGVVELGASGFNSFVVRIDGQKNWQLEKSEFGNSLVLENITTPDDVRRGLKTYIGQMLDYGVGARDIHFVVSSGAAMADVTKRIVPVLRELGYQVQMVTAEQEGVYGLRAALPREFTGRAFVLDLGSGNTKVAWWQGKQAQTQDSYGAKYYQQGIDDATVSGAVRAAAGGVPPAQRATCFVLGGVPYELAKASRRGQERYTTLRLPADYAASVSGAKAKSGLVIYQAVAEATGCQQFVFDWDANFTIGYLLSLP